MKIDRSPLGVGWQRIVVSGEVDLATVDDLVEALDEAFDSGTDHVLVDLSGTSFMDSTGLKSLVTAQPRFEEKERSFAVLVKPGPISRLFDITGMDQVFRVVSELEEIGEA